MGNAMHSDLKKKKLIFSRKWETLIKNINNQYLIIDRYTDDGSLALPGDCFTGFCVARHEFEAGDERRVGTFDVLDPAEAECDVDVHAAAEHGADSDELAARTDGQCRDC